MCVQSGALKFGLVQEEIPNHVQMFTDDGSMEFKFRLE